jgi:hypothetical protein
MNVEYINVVSPSIVPLSDSISLFMGRSFLVGGGWYFHRTGLDRPARFFLGAWTGGVVCFHASSLIFLAIAEMATDGNGRCGLLRGANS